MVADCTTDKFMKVKQLMVGGTIVRKTYRNIPKESPIVKVLHRITLTLQAKANQDIKLRVQS